jgi:hypothetical protein
MSGALRRIAVTIRAPAPALCRVASAGTSPLLLSLGGALSLAWFGRLP